MQVDESLQADLLTLINDELSLDPENEVHADTDLVLTGQVDSLGVMEIVDWLEERMQVLVDPADIIKENFKSVDQMVSFVSELDRIT